MKRGLALVIWLLLLGLAVSAGVRVSGQAPNPTATVKACHICGETDELPPSLSATATCDECALGATRASVMGTVIADRPRPTEGPVVRAVLFWRAGCPHCHEVIDDVLPPLQAQYGAQLEILLVEVATEEDADLLYAAASAFGLPGGGVGVPFLIVGDRALIGSLDIPAHLPGLIEHYLALGGTDWPDLLGLRPLLPKPTAVKEPSTTAGPAAFRAGAAAVATATPDEDGTPSVDGFSLAVAVMIGVSAAIVYSLAEVTRRRSQSRRRRYLPTREGSPLAKDWSLPALAFLGLAVSLYLFYVQITPSEAVCGPVGDCNTVSASPYARLFGVIPIGLLGIVGYAAILFAWLGASSSGRVVPTYASWALLGMAFLATVFSLYLTFLEAFVIRAVCLWCLLSTATMTLILLRGLSPIRQNLGYRR